MQQPEEEFPEETEFDQMAKKDPMSGFVPVQPGDMGELLNVLFSEDNIDTKTEISNPGALASLKTLGSVASDMGFEAGDLVLFFVKVKNIFMLSKGRASRREFERCYTNMPQQEGPTMGDRMLKDLKEERK